MEETWVKIRGQARPVGVGIARQGRLLPLAVTGPDLDWEAWLEDLATWEVEVVVTDEAPA